MSYSPSITAKPGRQFTLKVSNQASPTSFVTVGGLQNVRLSLNNNVVDITNMASGGIRELLPDGGIQQFSISADGIFDSNTVGFDKIREAAQNRTILECQIISGHGDSFIGYMAVTQFERVGALADAEKFSLTMENSGALGYTAG